MQQRNTANRNTKRLLPIWSVVIGMPLAAPQTLTKPVSNVDSPHNSAHNQGPGFKRVA